MSNLSNSPRVQKGALIGLDPANPLASIIIFQYNPEKMVRSLTPQTTGGNGGGAGAAAPGEAMRLAGPPQESIRFDELAIDATDQLAGGDPLAATLGLHPQLAALEMLLYPKSALVIVNEVLMNIGLIEVIAPEVPLAILVWGIKRVLPVRLKSLSVTETMFDSNLNPIQATVNLELQVLTYRDLGLLTPGGALFMAHQIIKETLAVVNTGATAVNAAGSASFSASISI